MQFIIIHKTNPQWEAGVVPSAELIARVGAMIGELSKKGVLHGGEGLRASSLGARVRMQGGSPTITRGPLVGENELPAALTIVRAASLDDAVSQAVREAKGLGDVEFDVRPLTEAWDLGMMEKPEGLTTTRYMLQQKATPASEAGATPKGGIALQPSARGRRLRKEGNDVRVIDGPFAESKELIAGYVLVSAGSLDEATELARQYLQVVDTHEADVREVATSERAATAS